MFSLKSSLEFDLLHDAGLMSEPQVIRKKILRINTKSLYTQMKYNLLREESEGFAKVLSLLHTGVTQDQLEASKTDLLALIGYFDLDANRVLDLVLDAYEMHPQNHCFAELLSAFKRDSIPHVIGFKFQFYKRENVTSGIVTPHSLYRLAATLIAKNMLAMDALLPHLAPSKEEIVKLHMTRVKKLEDEARSFGKVNLGGSKGDDKMDAEKAQAEASGADDHNQVFGLIVGMLEIGSKKQAFEMIQWFQERGVNPLAYKPLSAQLCASVHSLVELLYEPLSLKKMQLVATSNSSATKKKEVASKASDDDDKKPKTLVTPLTTQDELVAVVFPILEMLGAQLHHDELLFTKLLRIIGHLLENEVKKATTTAITIEEEFEGSLMAKVKDLIVKSFLPAITYQSSNPSSVFQLWDLIKLYPFDQRYRMYQQWQAAYASSPEMKLVEAQVVQNTRKVMRRLTADRAKPSARSLTHFAHSNPLIVFRTMLRQIQSYDNLIQPVVESFKFITPLGMDVLSFVLVSELAKSRQSMKSDGTNISLWLASLASFSGSFYRKYPNVELAGLLQYLIQRLQNWESVDLVVLSELLSKMGSCISFEDISLSQLEAQAGGPHLWHEPADPKLMNRRAIPRLRDALVKRNLALPLCLLICQMRSRIEYQESSPLTHLKLLGRVYDTCQMTLSQLLQFLNGVVDPLVYTKMLPSVSALVQDYHIQAELAMTLCRPAIRFDDPVLRKAPRSIHATGTSSSSAAENGVETRRNWFMNAPELIDDISSAIKSSAAGSDPFVGMTKDLYVMFWSLILYDIHVPFPQYEFEILRLRNSLSTAGNSGGVNGGPLTASERKKLKEKTSQMIDKLTNEQKDQVAHRKRVYERLEEKKKVFFAREAADSRTAVQELLQKCVIPRALLSPEDALFCAKFMERVHYINTPEFSTLQYYNTINLKLPSMVLCVTEREAGNFGIFLKETVTLLYRWYQSGATYEEDALHGKSGFSVDLNDPKKKLPHRQYKLVYAKWHKWMAKVFSTTLASEEYMPMRNTLIILTKLIDVFPASKSTAESMLEIVEALTKEDREDIKIMAKRYFALLTKRKSSLVEDKLLAVAVAKKPATVKETKDTAVDEPVDEMDGVEAAIATPIESEKPVATTNSSSSSGANAGAESSRERRAPPARVLRQDLESGEISTPPPSTQSNSSRRSSERPPVSNDSAKGGDNANSNRSSNQQRLKRRDSDRGIAAAGGTPEENSSHNNSSRRGDEKRGRRETREGRDAREVSPGKPSVGLSSSSINSRSGNAAGAPADVPVVSGHKRDRSRERRSRSPEGRGRGNGRDRGERGGASEKDGSSSRGERDAPRDSSVGNNSNSEQLSSGESRKRQRVDPSAAEAALRRQLTEKKGQDQRRDSRDRQDGSQSKSESASRGSGGNGDGVPPRSGGEGAPTRGEVDRSERQQQPSPAAAGTTRKIVSLVSSSRKREQPSQDEDDRRSSAQAQPAPVASEEGDRSNDERRRRDSGRGGGGHGRREGGGDGGGEQKRGSQDEKKKSRGHGRKNNGDGGGGQPQQQRDQG